MTTRRIAAYFIALLGVALFIGVAIFAGGKPSTIHPPTVHPTSAVTTSTAPHEVIPTHKAASPKVKVTKATVLHRRGPSAADYAELASARRDSGMICHLEYDGPGAGYEAICAPPRECAKVDDRLMTACINLYHRKAESHTDPDGSALSNPAGPALVRECTSQYTDYAELKACLTQPHI